jgi:hypothetical protein
MIDVGQHTCRKHSLGIAWPTMMLVVLIMSSANLILGVQAGPDRKEQKSNGRDRYTQLYDIIFPRQMELAPGKEQFVLTLRYWLTTRSPDFQYSLTKYHDGSVKVVALRTQQPLYSYLDLKYPLDSISDREFAEAMELVKKIPIERTEVSLPREKAQKIISGFVASSAPQLRDLNLIHFDGTSYDLWFEAGSYRMSYSLSGETLGSQNASNPLVKWMNLAHELLSQSAWNRSPQKTAKSITKP